MQSTMRKSTNFLLFLTLLMLASAAQCLAASADNPAYRTVLVKEGAHWSDGLSIDIAADEKLCRSRYGENWWSACSAALGEPGNLVRGVTLTPDVPGTWRWDGQTSMRFTPKDPMKPGTRYTVGLSGLSVPRSVKLSQKQAVVMTRPMAVSLESWKFFADPSKRAEHIVTCSLAFTYPQDARAMEAVSVVAPALETGMRIGDIEKVWNAAHDRLNLAIHILTLPAKATPLTVRVPGMRRMTKEKGKEVYSPVGSEKGGVAFNNMVVTPNAFAINKVSVKIVEGENLAKGYELEVVSSVHVRPDEFVKHCSAIEMPLTVEPGADRPCDWSRKNYIPTKFLENGRKLVLRPIGPADVPTGRLRFAIDAKPGTHVAVDIDAELTCVTGAKLGRRWLDTYRAADAGSSVTFLQPGNVLPLSGTNRIDLRAIGLDKLTWKAWQVRRPFLAAIASSDMSAPVDGSGLSVEQVGVPAEGSLEVASTAPGKGQVVGIDLGGIVKSTASSDVVRGLIELYVEGWKDGKSVETAHKFVLVTDLGLVVKKGAAGTYDVFACSLASGAPAQDVTVSVLGRNGLPIASAQTNAQGRASVKVRGNDETTPVAIVAERAGTDVAWLPLSDSSLNVDWSNAEGGEFIAVNGSLSESGLHACVFSERGVFRPGETLRFGCVLRRGDWAPLEAGIPLSATLSDPVGRTVMTKTFVSGADGLADFAWQAPDGAMSGRYCLDVRTAGKDGEVLGSASVRIADFQPDTMRASLVFVAGRTDGWVRSDSGFTGLEAKIQLQDLYGSPAKRRRVASRVTVEPTSVDRFPGAAGEHVYGWDASGASRTKVLDEVVTGEDGTAVVRIPADLLKDGNLRVTLECEGFEPDGGRAVSVEARTLVSPLPFVLTSAEGAGIPRLGFIPKGRDAKLHLLARSPELSAMDAGELELTVSERTFVSNLVSDGRGSYRYSDTAVSKPVSSERKTLSAQGVDVTLPTTVPGEYDLTVRDTSGRLLAEIPFTVAGDSIRADGELASSSLRMRIEKASLSQGEEVRCMLTVPYDGTGLMTIERDGVVAHRWFSAKAGSSVQAIPVPNDFEGRGFVTVCFARSLQSPDIYMRPLAAAAAAFTAGVANRDMGLKLEAPQRVEPGQTLSVKLNAAQAGRAVIFAVDEGILQLTGYRTPSPIADLLLARGLSTQTLQNLDLVMPDHAVLGTRPGFGGGDDAEAAAFIARMENPFKRRNEPPLVWWSGVIDVPAGGTSVDIPVPAYSQGSLRVMAVGANAQRAGNARTAVTVRGTCVLMPQVPMAVAPGDRFEAACFANVEGGGNVTLKVQASGALRLAPEAATEATISGEGTQVWRVSVADEPGESALTFTGVTADGKTTVRRVSVSVRPQTPLVSEMEAGRTKGSTEVGVSREVYDFGSNGEISLSALPVPVLRGLLRYVDAWPYGCTEQLVSKAFPYVVLSKRPDLMVSPTRNADKVRKEGAAIIDAAVQAIVERNDEGAVSLWSDGDGNNLLTVYVADFLMTMREEGLSMPAGLLEKVCDRVETIVSSEATTPEDARMKAYGIWVLSREGRVMTQPMQVLERFVQDNGLGADVSAALIGGTKVMLHYPNVSAPTPISPARLEAGSWFDVLASEALRATVLARNFSESYGGTLEDLVASASAALGKGGYCTFSSSQVIRAIAARTVAASAPSLAGVSVNCIDGGLATIRGENGMAVLSASLPQCRRWSINVPASYPQELYWQVATTGYTRNVPAKGVARSLEVTHLLTNLDGTPVTSVRQGEVLVSTVRVRTKGSISNVVLCDLVPGGFEPVLAKDGAVRPEGVTSLVRREDRTIAFGTVSDEMEIVTRMRATSRGTFSVPPATAQSMYDQSVFGSSDLASVEVR